MADHVTTVCRAGYYQLLRQLCQIIQSLTPTVAQTLVPAGLHQLLARLLQFVALWNWRHPTKASTVRPERGSTSDDWFPVTSLATGTGNGFCSSWWYWFTNASMGVHLPTWQMTAAWSAAAGPVLDRRRQRPNWRSHLPERRLATDLLPSTYHAGGTVYRHPFATRHWHSLFSATDSRPISLNSGCGVCDFEQTPSNVLTN